MKKKFKSSRDFHLNEEASHLYPYQHLLQLLNLPNDLMNQQIPKHISAEDLNTWLQKKSLQPLLIDVREDNELLMAPFPSEVVHLPLSKASLWMKTFPEQLTNEQAVVVICHAGIRSWNFGCWLLQQFSDIEVWNLEGGIDSWSIKVDSSVPRY